MISLRSRYHQTKIFTCPPRHSVPSSVPSLYSQAKSRQKGKERINDTGNTYNSDFLFGKEIGDLKRYVVRILCHDQSTVEFKPDGTIFITPHLRPFPNEIISLIINHLHEQHVNLYQCALVTKQFHAIVNPLIWKKLDFWSNDIGSTRFLTATSNASPERLSNVGQYIHEFCFGGRGWSHTQLARWVPHLPHLKKLVIQRTALVTDLMFQHLSRNCHQHLTLLKLDYTRLTYHAFSGLAKYCHQLKDFEWKLWPRQSATWLDEMTTSCPLERLSITTCHYAPLDEHAINVIKKFNSLTCLDIDRAHSTTSLLLPLPNTIVPWPSLTTLIIHPCNTLDDTTWIEFIQSHPHLQDIRLNVAYVLSDISLDAMAIGLPNVKSISIYFNQQMTPNGIRRLISGCRRLEYIWLDCFNHVAGIHFWELEEVQDFDYHDRDRAFFDQTAIDIIRERALGNNNNQQ